MWIFERRTSRIGSSGWVGNYDCNGVKGKGVNSDAGNRRFLKLVCCVSLLSCSLISSFSGRPPTHNPSASFSESYIPCDHGPLRPECP